MEDTGKHFLRTSCGILILGIKKNNLPEFISHVSTSTSLSRANFGEGFESESSQLQEGCRRVAVEKAMHVLGGKCQEKSSSVTFHLSMPVYHVAYKIYMCTHSYYIHLDFHGNMFACPFFHTRKERRPERLQVQSCFTRSRIINEGGEPQVQQIVRLLQLSSFYHSTPSWKQKEISKKSIFLKGDRIERFGNNMSTLCEVFLQPRFTILLCCTDSSLPNDTLAKEKKTTLGGS